MLLSVNLTKCGQVCIALKIAADVFHSSSLRLGRFGKLFYMECSHQHE